MHPHYSFAGQDAAKRCTCYRGECGHWDGGVAGTCMEVDVMGVWTSCVQPEALVERAHMLIRGCLHFHCSHTV